MSKNITSRCWEFQTLLVHPETGETLFDVAKIKDTCAAHSSIISYAYIIHDKDVYTSEDKEFCGEDKIGELKGPHLHLVMKFSRSQALEPLALWFGFAGKENYFSKKNNGRGKRDAYLDSCVYLTHEDEKQQLLGKHLYEDSEVTFYHEDGYTFRDFINLEKKKIEDSLSKYGKADVSQKEKIRYMALYEGATLNQIRRDYPMEYMDDIDAIKKMRDNYLVNQPAPPYRINLYVTGAAGGGKSLICSAIARALIDPEGIMDDEEIFCYASGNEHTTFESYDGQPVIIWDDFRSNEIFKGCSENRGNIFKVFAVNPSKVLQNKKYSKVNLINTINIVNSVQPFGEFVDGLSGEYISSYTGDLIKSEEQDKKQSYRRFPISIRVYNGKYSLSVNEDFFGISDDYTKWDFVAIDVEADLRSMIIDCGTNKKLYNQLAAKAVAPIVKKIKEAEAIMSHSQKGTDEELLKKYELAGESH